MSISNNIDGSVGGGNQLLDFISLVTNPKVYEAKLKSLQDATEANQKFVELIAPATEILDLKDKIAADKIASAKALDDAKAKADELVKKATEKAQALVDEAQAKAAQLTSEAEAAAEDAKVAQAEARSNANAAKKAKADYDSLNSNLVTQQADLAKALADAEKAKKEADTLRSDLIEKHTAFIKGL